MAPIAFITGIAGQDGTYLAHLLRGKGYDVHGLLLPQQRPPVGITAHYGDLTDGTAVHKHILGVRPNEVYNLAAQTHVKYGETMEAHTIDVNLKGVLYVLQACHTLHKQGHKVKVYQAGTSEEFGTSGDGRALDETSPRNPVSVYGITKLAARQLCEHYRRAYGMYIVSGTLFNHESPLRPSDFVTTKIIHHVRRWGVHKTLELGNLDAKRDWGYARHYVVAMHSMMQMETPTDLVIASGRAYSVREFIEEAYSMIGEDVLWTDGGTKGYSTQGHLMIKGAVPEYERATEIDCLLGNATLARHTIGWQEVDDLTSLVQRMYCDTGRDDQRLRQDVAERPCDC